VNEYKIAHISPKEFYKASAPLLIMMHLKTQI